MSLRSSLNSATLFHLKDMSEEFLKLLKLLKLFKDIKEVLNALNLT